MTSSRQNSLDSALLATPTVAPRPLGLRWRMAFLRGIVWSLIGLVYAPLFTGLAAFLQSLGWSHAAYLAAGGLAGGIGAALYGARELSLIGTGLGVAVGVVTLMGFADSLTFMQSAGIAAGIAITAGFWIPFPTRCSRAVPGKTLAGLMTGALCGGALALAEWAHPFAFSIFVVLALMVSVNGILYVASVRWWVELSRRLHCESRSCRLVESLVMAVLAGLAAGSVWMVTGPLLDPEALLWRDASALMHDHLPLAVAGAMFGGGLAGLLLEFFRFSWVHDL